MEKITNPNVKLLAKGESFIAKQMAAKAGELLPKHLANKESVLVVLEGECVLTLADTEHTLKQGDSFIVPPEIVHQIKVVKDFRAVHIMTNDIEFKFFK
ncbi:cupin domain-containing protein [Arenibacter latericius]|uniref:cupin domain-containing protein n=1 Tax=Arenibacter latericius TaxID=86104 RepID=UPI0004085DA2|nr:cupin domain-containing protein [Arenibacter latericius]MDX1363030.1 cupin domain-containing protein [Arenibacter latericius]